MTTETLGALRMRRDTLERDLSALASGDSGSRLSAKEAHFYQSRLMTVDGLLKEPRAKRVGG